MWAIIGLGNPGEEYKNNRHNLGYMAVDFLCERHSISLEQIGPFYLWGNGEIFEQEVILVKPQTYVNKSGMAVKDLLEKESIELPKIIVIHDDIDLPVAEFRMKNGGGSGGHNGLRSIIKELGSPSFLRARVGVGRPKIRGERMEADYVLEDFKKDEYERITEVFFELAESIEGIIKEDIGKNIRDSGA